MLAIWRDEYGAIDILLLKPVPVPVPGPDYLLVRVHAAGLNRSNCETLKGRPFYARMTAPFRPRVKILGTDLAGEVVQAGAGVQGFRAGDRVMADVMYHGHGAFAEFALVRKGAPVARVPDGVSWSQAAALPQAGTIALQGLAGLREGDSALLIGGGGATGIFAIQLAKARGAVVTGVDSAEKLALMRELGADHVIDYRQADFGRLQGSFNLILDPIAGLTPSLARRLLRPGGSYYLVGGSTRRLLMTLTSGMRNRSAGTNVNVLSRC